MKAALTDPPLHTHIHPPHTHVGIEGTQTPHHTGGEGGTWRAVEAAHLEQEVGVQDVELGAVGKGGKARLHGRPCTGTQSWVIQHHAGC